VADPPRACPFAHLNSCGREDSTHITGTAVAEACAVFNRRRRLGSNAVLPHRLVERHADGPIPYTTASPRTQSHAVEERQYGNLAMRKSGRTPHAMPTRARHECRTCNAVARC
jgi:hypothetical protein